MTSWECYENKWFYMKYIGKYLSEERLLTRECTNVPARSVPITTNVVSSTRLWRGVLDTTLCDKVCQWLATRRWFSRVLRFPPVSSTNETDLHNITEILLKVALSTKKKLRSFARLPYEENITWDALG
jgi:hypothetical protein